VTATEVATDPDGSRVTTSGEQSDHSLEYLRARLAVVEARVKALVAWRRASDPDPADPYRGVYVGDAQVDRLLTPTVIPDELMDGAIARLALAERAADEAEAEGHELRLRSLTRRFGLDGLAVEAVLIALAPDVDSRFEKLYGYLHDDLTRRRASPNLVLELTGSSPLDHRCRATFGPASALARHALVVPESVDRPALTRALSVPDRVVNYLLGHDEPDPRLDGLLHRVRPVPDEHTAGVGRAVAGGGHCYLRGSSLGAGVAAVEAAGARPLTVDFGFRSTEQDAISVVEAALLEARLQNLVLVAGPIDALPEGSTEAVHRLASDDRANVLVGVGAWDASWSRRPRLVIEASVAAGLDRRRKWREAGAGELAEETSLHPFRVTVDQAERALQVARLNALRYDREVAVDDVMTGVRALNAPSLERLARRVVPSVRLDDLVLPPAIFALVAEIELRARHRADVSARYGLGVGRSDGKGVTALLTGPPGTGKTMAAEAVASSLGFDLYVVDLATVVDKYIGETEKQLERVFREAEGVNGVLFFDEADALFGKRSEVSDAKDRYANLEIAYLLQRMETFDGVTVLATNLGANLDEAFLRRLDVVAELPLPDAAARLQLWDRSLGQRLPRAADVNLEMLAERYELSGGHIRNIGLLAAFLALEDDQPVAMSHLLTALQRELRKSGRLYQPPS